MSLRFQTIGRGSFGKVIIVQQKLTSKGNIWQFRIVLRDEDFKEKRAESSKLSDLYEIREENHGKPLSPIFNEVALRILDRGLTLFRHGFYDGRRPIYSPKENAPF